MRNSRADVVAAALHVLEQHGLEQCSMRRVAAELGVQPSALYHHVPDKQSLLALMADEIVRGVSAPASRAAGDPSRAAAELCFALRAAMLAVRDGADVVATAAAFRLGASRVEGEIAALVGADGARTLLVYTFGQAQSTQTHRQAAAFGALPAPASAAEDGSDLDASFARGIGIILRGIAVPA